jgi:hypothetical protein
MHLQLYATQAPCHSFCTKHYYELTRFFAGGRDWWRKGVKVLQAAQGYVE